MIEKKERLEVEAIRNEYEKRTELTKIEELRSLDRKIKLPVEIFTYSFGIAGALVLGVGMCLAIEVLGAGLMLPGIIIGLAGIAMASVNPLIYNKWLRSRKNKRKDEILKLADSLLNK